MNLLYREINMEVHDIFQCMLDFFVSSEFTLLEGIEFPMGEILAHEVEG